MKNKTSQSGPVNQNGSNEGSMLSSYGTVESAFVVLGAIAVLSEHILDGQIVIETTCHTFDHYRSLPSVVRYRDTDLVLTGWSSDSCRACYKQSHRIAYSRR